MNKKTRVKHLLKHHKPYTWNKKYFKINMLEDVNDYLIIGSNEYNEYANLYIQIKLIELLKEIKNYGTSRN